MAGELLPMLARAADNNNNVYNGAKWHFYATGGLTPQAVYADADLGTSLGAVVAADSAGKFAPVYFDASLAYRGILKSADGATTIFDIDPINTGAVSILLPFIPNEIRSAKSFGVAFDGETDSSTEIQAYAAYLSSIADSQIDTGGEALAAANRPTFYIPPGPGIVTTVPISISKNVPVVMDAPLWIRADADALPSDFGDYDAWLDIGSNTTFTAQSRSCNYVLDVRRETQSDWSSEADIGVKINAAECLPVLKRIDGFTVGVKMTAPYSTVTLGGFGNNQIGLDITGDTVSNDFTNQMVFIGGEFACRNNVGLNLARYGVRITHGGGADPTDNGNSITFIGTSFELAAASAGAQECRPFVISAMSSIRGQRIRMEHSGTAVARLENDCRWCQFELAYDGELTYPTRDLLVDNSTYKIGNRAWPGGGDFDWQAAYRVFDSGPLIDAANNYNGLTLYSFAGMEFAVNNGAAPNPPTFALFATITSLDYKGRSVNLGSSYLGTRVDVRETRCLCVVVDGPTTKDLTMTVLAFDANGNQLTANTDVLQNASTPTVTSNTGVYGGAYFLTTTLDSTKSAATIGFSSNVATAFIGIGGGALRSFRIYAVSGTANAFSRATIRGPGRKYASAAPANGWYARGTQVWNPDPSAGGSPGWVCTTQGQSGTLVGVTANTTATSRSVTFSDATNLWIGSAVTIAGVAGTKIIEALQGNTAFVDTACDATVAGGAVAYVAPVFKAMANLAA